MAAQQLGQPDLWSSVETARGFPAPSKSELDEKRGASHIGVRILNGACQMRQTRPHSHHQREASRDEPREDAAPLLPQTQETLSRN